MILTNTKLQTLRGLSHETCTISIESRNLLNHTRLNVASYTMRCDSSTEYTNIATLNHVAFRRLRICDSITDNSWNCTVRILFAVGTCCHWLHRNYSSAWATFFSLEVGFCHSIGDMDVLTGGVTTCRARQRQTEESSVVVTWFNQFLQAHREHNAVQCYECLVLFNRC